MRWLLPILLGCSSSHHGVSADAAPPAPDADSRFCDTGADSAHVTLVTGGASHVFTSAFAGGTVGGGGVLPLTGQPMSVSMMFTDELHLSVDTALCCDGGGTCCTLEGVVANTTEELLPGSELGSHPVMIRTFQDTSFTLQGTLNVTDYIGPFDQAPGRISGSISSSDNSVSGTFANTFCSALFEYPI